MKVMALIPARGGSKGVPGKNGRLLGGRPLLTYAIETAKASRNIRRIVISTDDENLAQIGRESGVDVPFLRPAEQASDTAPMLGVIRHALAWLEAEEGYCPDVVVLLQPTTPFRRAEDIDGAIDLLERESLDAVVSVSEVPTHYNAFWQFTVTGNALRPSDGRPWPELIARRQDLPPTYTRNGAFYVFRRERFLETGSLYGERCGAWIMPPTINIDTMDDWRQAEQFLQAERFLENDR